MKKLLSIAVLCMSLFLPSSVFPLDIKLIWNPNTESDLAGYKVYRGTAPGGPYVKLGEIQATNFVWAVPTGTEASNYFVITAYDTAGNESGYSNEASIYIDNKPPIPPTGIQVIVIIVTL